jgi:cystathionine beta-lyase/cystathionine gamma-synthase
MTIAKRLQNLDIVEQVCHPGLANRLPAGLNGTSGLFSFILREGIDIRTFADHLKLFKLGVSWGGHESLIVPGEVVLQQKAQPNSAHTFGINARSVRLHVGLEGTEALWRDIEEAIAAAS